MKNDENRIEGFINRFSQICSCHSNANGLKTSVNSVLTFANRLAVEHAILR